MATISMTPENKPFLDALMRMAAGFYQDATAIDTLTEAILELMEKRAEVAQWREIGQAVATSAPTSYVTHRDDMRCAACGEYYELDINTGEFADIHKPDCVVERARALLAAEAEAAAERSASDDGIH